VVDSLGEREEGVGITVASIGGVAVWFAVGRRGREQDGRRGEKVGLTLLVACLSICEGQGKHRCETRSGSFLFGTSSAYFYEEAR
jgi:hypothetical protein